MLNSGFAEKRKNEDKILKTNCFDCEIMLTKETLKLAPDNGGDKRIFCKKDWKKRFGKKKKLKKRY